MTMCRDNTAYGKRRYGGLQLGERPRQALPDFPAASWPRTAKVFGYQWSCDHILRTQFYRRLERRRQQLGRSWAWYTWFNQLRILICRFIVFIVSVKSESSEDGAMVASS